MCTMQLTVLLVPSLPSFESILNILFSRINMNMLSSKFYVLEREKSFEAQVGDPGHGVCGLSHIHAGGWAACMPKEVYA